MSKPTLEKYHSIEQGCEIVKKRYFESGDAAHCKIHKKDICRCGWEWGWHYGTESKPLNKKYECKIF